jgi:oligoribonuclease
VVRSCSTRTCTCSAADRSRELSVDRGNGESPGARVSRKDNLIWIDLEMTGLNPEQHRIIEIATVVTDKELTVLAEGPVLAIHQPDDHLGTMDEWNTRQHANSGLTERVRASAITEQEAESLTLEFLRQHVDHGASPICGNSICQDRRFLIRHMPELAAFFHYRNLDVSTLKILAKLWLPEVGNRFEKKSVHLALADIHDSIRELRFYREHLFRR